MLSTAGPTDVDGKTATRRTARSSRSSRWHVRSAASKVRPTIHDLITDDVLDAAYDWLCRQRHDYYPDHADVWTLRRTWATAKATLRADLLAGRYRLGLLRRIVNRDGDRLDLWAARDAVVLKALALVLGTRLPCSRRCTHLKGHGGSAGARRQVRQALPSHCFVLRTDVREYYASIDHDRLLDRLAGAPRGRGVGRWGPTGTRGGSGRSPV